MQIEHLGTSPDIHPTAFVAPDATICGNVKIGAGACIMHGARIVAETGEIIIGSNCIVLQNAVIRATGNHHCRIGRNVLVGPTAHIVGATIEDDVFIATGASIFHSSRIGSSSVVRINGIVHVNTALAPKTVVPVGWIAVGDPAQLFSTDRHDEIWEIQSTLKFMQTAYGIDAPMPESMKAVAAAVSERLSAHRDDTVIG